ncbi:MAG: transporter [Muribaculaceae bacterium]|nr:transporter [Muribaculaceae bacterium]
MNKLVKILKEWTLPVSMTTGILVYFIFYFTPALDEASRVFNSFFDFILPWILFVILFVTFCRADFHRMRPCWWHFVILAMQLVLVILSTVLIVHYNAKGNELVLMECIICCVICPCATAAPVVTAKLDGDLEKMTTFMLLSNFLAAVLIPAVFPLVDESIDMPFWDAFLALLERVCTVLLAPMALAYLVKHFAPRLHSLIISNKDLSFYLWGVLLLVISGATMRNIMNSGTTVWFIVVVALTSLAITFVQFSMGRYVGRYFHATTEMGQAMGQKNTAFAIWISSAWLHPLAAVGLGFYILWQNAFNSLEIWHHEKQKHNS